MLGPSDMTKFSDRLFICISNTPSDSEKNLFVVSKKL